MAVQMANDPAVSSYGADEGLPALRDALRRQVRQDNGLEGVRVQPSYSPCCGAVTTGWRGACAAVPLTMLWCCGALRGLPHVLDGVLRWCGMH